jgi:hypothetical protein
MILKIYPPKWVNVREKSQVKQTQEILIAFVGSDSEKFNALRIWSEACLDFLENWPADDKSPQPEWTKRDFVKSISTLLRGKPGRHKKNVFAEAYALRQTNPVKWSYSKLALHFWREQFLRDPGRARNRMKSGLNRLAKQHRTRSMDTKSS